MSCLQPKRTALPAWWRAGPDARHVVAIEAAIAVASPTSTSPVLSAWYESYAENHKVRLAFDLELIERFATRDAAMVEFGSCPPILTVALTRAGYSVCGLDLAPDRFEGVCRREGLTVKEVNFEEEPLPFADDAVDVVVFNEVFEHLRVNPIFTFREINRVLRPQGTLLLSTPNLTSLRGWWNLAVKGQPANDLYDAFEKLETLGHVGHVRLYTPLEVATFLKKMGFAVHLICHRGDGGGGVEVEKRPPQRAPPGLPPLADVLHHCGLDRGRGGWRGMKGLVLPPPARRHRGRQGQPRGPWPGAATAPA